MTAYRLVTLTCDCCGEIWDDGRSSTFPAARSTAAAIGWTHGRIGGYDWCNKCSGLQCIRREGCVVGSEVPST